MAISTYTRTALATALAFAVGGAMAATPVPPPDRDDPRPAPTAQQPIAEDHDRHGQAATETGMDRGTARGGTSTTAQGATDRTAQQRDAADPVRSDRVDPMTAADESSDQPIADTWITTQVNAQLVTEDSVSAMDISVSTTNGEVVLSGEVENAEQIRTAERIARDVDGVVGVDTTQLRVVQATTEHDAADHDATVRRDAAVVPTTAAADTRMETADRSHEGESDQPVADTWITTKVKTQLLADGDVSGMDISVSTTNGEVALSGEVENAAQIQAAERIARETEGVQRVDTTGLRVEPVAAADEAAPAERNPRAAETTAAAGAGATTADRSHEGESDQPVADTWITTKVKTQLLADGDVPGMDISVSTTNGVVTLEGEVESAAQAELAERIARDVDGVVGVETVSLQVHAPRQAQIDP